MDINFPLIMVVLVFAGAIIWLVDAMMFASKRRAKIATAQQAGASEKEIAELSIDPMLVDYAKSFTPVLALVLVVRSFMFEPFQIPSSSMVPTLQVGDFILVNKFDYGLRLPVVRTKIWENGDPQRGDVMVFFPPHKPTTYYIKRVIGLPGDVIEYRDKVLYINGVEAEQQFLSQGEDFKLLQESLLGVSHQIHTMDSRNFRNNFRAEVPAGHYFMMGDNRDNSSDSRVWGFVPEGSIVGKAVAVWLHWEDFFSIPSFETAGSIQ